MALIKKACVYMHECGCSVLQALLEKEGIVVLVAWFPTEGLSPRGGP